MSVNISYTVRGLKKLERATDPRRFQAVLKKHMRVAAGKNGRAAVAAQHAVIRGTKLAKNHGMTILIKHSRKPLIDTGELYRGIEFKIIDDWTVFAGVTRTSGKYDIAKLVHDGKILRVTPKMRGMFFALWLASQGELDPSKLIGRAAELWAEAPGGWKPLGVGTTRLVIPGRPWEKIAMSEPQLVNRIKTNWEEAMDRTFHELAR